MNQRNVSVVITSISPPNNVMKSIALGCTAHRMSFYVIGDVPSPAEFSLDGCRFVSLNDQLQTGLRTAELVPQRHYARKNIGYLLAIKEGAQIILETDDDNFPRPGFWDDRARLQTLPSIRDTGWLNVYRYFSDENIWPRGLPLDSILNKVPEFESLTTLPVDCPIQQGLADQNPDVDAIYRLILPLPLDFRKDRRVALGVKSWCPFNSQNTTWFRDCFPLLYLPAYCSFRMTDIWRSLIAQRIAWNCGWHILFHEPTVYQERNDHSLMKDFEEEIPGYLKNRKIAHTLDAISLKGGKENLTAHLRACYEKLVEQEILEPRELPLLEAWIADLESVSKVNAL